MSASRLISRAIPCSATRRLKSSRFCCWGVRMGHFFRRSLSKASPHRQKNTPMAMRASDSPIKTMPQTMMIKARSFSMDLILNITDFTIHDSAYMALSYAKFVSNLCLVELSRCFKLPYLFNLLVVEHTCFAPTRVRFGVQSARISIARCATTSVSKICPSFFNHIKNVFTRCSNPKMVRVYTSRIVAGVTHIHAFWNCAIVNDPRRPTCLDWAVIKSHFDCAISKFRFVGCPFPAAIFGQFANFAPKTRLECIRKSDRKRWVLFSSSYHNMKFMPQLLQRKEICA